MAALSASRTSLWVTPILALTPQAADAAIQYTASGVDLWGSSLVNVPVNFSGAGVKVTVRGTTSSSSSFDATLRSETSQFLHAEDGALSGIFSSADPNALAAGILIGPTVSFNGEGRETLVSISSTSSVSDGNFGYFPGVQRYLGVQFDHAGNTHYGWIGFLYTPYAPGIPPSFVITGWAWDDTPGNPILTGDMGLVSADSPSGGGAGAAAAAAAANTQNNVRLQQQQQAAAARVARQKVAQQHRRNQQR